LRKESFAPLRYRQDGSVYFQKHHPLWSAIGEVIAIVLFTLIALLVVALAIVQPSDVAQAQQQNVRRSLEKTVNEITAPTLAPKALVPEPDLPAHDTRLPRPMNIPSLWPVTGVLTDGFGHRRNPFTRRHSPFRASSSQFHTGQDIAAPMGTPVAVTAEGTIVFAGWMNGYGQLVIVDHGDNISTRYGHLSKIETVLDRTVKRGEEIGRVGSTGRSTGPHLHYEVRVDDQPVDPLPYLPTSAELKPDGIDK
jgi:murein DD-endopeptidase MepM/ murein hydrolase activator NlpD